MTCIEPKMTEELWEITLTKWSNPRLKRLWNIHHYADGKASKLFREAVWRNYDGGACGLCKAYHYYARYQPCRECPLSRGKVCHENWNTIRKDSPIKKMSVAWSWGNEKQFFKEAANFRKLLKKIQRRKDNGCKEL